MLRKLLTTRCIELLQSMMTERLDSIRDLADRFNRSVKEIADDVNLLADYEIVHFEQDGRAKQPYVPYKSVKTEIEVKATVSSEGEEPAPA